MLWLLSVGVQQNCNFPSASASMALNNLALCRARIGISCCSDDEEAEGDAPISHSDRLKLEREAMVTYNSTVVKKLESAIEPGDEDLFQRAFEFEDEEFSLGSPAKKQKKGGERLTAAETKMDLKERATARWLPLLLRDPSASLAGKRLSAALPERHLPIVRTYVAKKSGNTLINRVGPIHRYVRWLDTDGADCDGWPPHEEAVIQFFEACCDERTAKSLISRMIQSITMTAFTFQFCRRTKMISDSVFLEGLAVQNLQMMPPVKSSKGLDLEFVVKQEVAVFYRRLTRVILMTAGDMLFLVYFRSRLGDTEEVLEVVVYECRIEVRVRDTKTGKLRMELVLMAPGATLSGLDWFSSFREWRVAQDAPIGEGWPVFPCLIAGRWTKAQAKTGDINELMSAVAAIMGWPPNVTSHRCKGALLEAAVIYGIPEPDRFVLGYHADNSKRAVNTYAPSIQLAPVAKLNGMVLAFAKGKWNPEAVKHPKVRGVDHAPDLENMESESEDEKPSSDVEALAQEEILNSEEMQEEPDDRWCQNIDNGKIHRGSGSTDPRTVCHNPIGEKIVIIDASEVDELTANLCKICFGRTLEKQRETLRRMTEPRPLIDTLVKGLFQ